MHKLEDTVKIAEKIKLEILWADVRRRDFYLFLLTKSSESTNIRIKEWIKEIEDKYPEINWS